MAKQVTITPYCDGEHMVRVVGEAERTISIDGGRPVVLDLCPEHNEIVQAVLTLMANGAPVAWPTKRKASSGPRSSYTTDLTCPIPGHETYVAPTRTALGSHARSKHDMTLRELDAARGVST